MDTTATAVATVSSAVADIPANDQDLSLIRELSALELSLVGGGFVNAHFG